MVPGGLQPEQAETTGQRRSVVEPCPAHREAAREGGRRLADGDTADKAMATQPVKNDLVGQPCRFPQFGTFSRE
jgi:hypothetical protein